MQVESSSEGRINRRPNARHISTLKSVATAGSSMKIVSVADAARASNDAPRTTLRIDNGTTAPVPPAVADSSSDQRVVLERELDRLQQAIQVDQQAAAQHLNWLLLSQALFLNAFLIVLVLGGSVPLPFTRALLVVLAALGVTAGVILYATLHRTRDEIAMLCLQRRAVEITLQKDFGRVPMFPPNRSVMPSAALPIVFVAAWALLVAYALLTPR
jgi:hypothetical protein